MEIEIETENLLHCERCNDSGYICLECGDAEVDCACTGSHFVSECDCRTEMQP